MELISKDDAIKDAESWVAVDGYEKHLQKIVIEWLKEFPSAELGTNLAEVGTDCISREQAIDALYHVDEYNSRSVEAIRKLPPAEPKIIRCKDCKHWIPYDWMFSEMWQSKNIADYPEEDIGCDCSEMAMKANDFCSRGERRIDGQSC